MNNDAGGKRRARFTRLAGAMAAFASLPSCAATNPDIGLRPDTGTMWAFAAPWDPRSEVSVRAHAAELEVVVSGWIQLDSITGVPVNLYPDDSARIRATGKRMALITSWHGERFHPEMVRRLASDGRALALTAARIAELLAAGGYQGLVFDLEGQSRADLPLTLRVIRAVRDSVRRRGAYVISVAVPAVDTTAYPTRAFMNEADFVLVMLYDEHGSTSSPGAVASPTWVRRTLASRVAEVGANRIIAGFPVYGYLWRPNHPGETISFAEAVHDAAQASVELVRDPSSQSLHATQRDAWELYATDATLLRALRAEASALGVRRTALWRLGLEDPAIWSIPKP